MLIEFFNTAIVVLIINFTGLSGISKSKQTAGYEEVKIRFEGFEPDSYRIIGRTLVVTLFLTTIVGNTLDAREFFSVIVKRFEDRKYNIRLGKLGGSDIPNT